MQTVTWEMLKMSQNKSEYESSYNDAVQSVQNRDKVGPPGACEKTDGVVGVHGEDQARD